MVGERGRLDEGGRRVKRREGEKKRRKCKVVRDCKWKKENVKCIKL